MLSLSLYDIQTSWTSIHVCLAQPELVLRRYDAWALDYNRGHDLDLGWGSGIIGLQNDDAEKYDCFRLQLILPVSVSIIISCYSGRTKTHLSKLQLYPEDLAVITGLDTVRHVLLS